MKPATPTLCGILGCSNEAVRTLEHKEAPKNKLNLCAYHVRRALKYVDDTKLRELVFPKDRA